MNIEQLRSFVAVAREGHFTRAAQEVHLAQPSLSRQIATLERDLGAALFHRARGNVSLTAAGQALLAPAQRILADAEVARRAVADVTEMRRGRVHLGATPTLCVSLVAEVFERFRDAYPGIELQLTEGGSRHLVDELARGALDLALVVDPGHALPAGLEHRPLLSEELVVISAAESEPLTDADSLSLAELAEQPLIAFGHDYDLRRVTDAAFETAGLTPDLAIDGVEMDAALRFVERGLGVAVAPAMVLVQRPGLRSVRLASPELTRVIALAGRTDMAPAQAVKEMVSTVRETVEAVDWGAAVVRR